MFEAAIIALVTLVGLIAQRVVGFGGGMLITPLLLVYFSAPVSVVITLFLGTIFSLFLLYRERQRLKVSWDLIFKMAIAALPGSLLGSYIVTRIDKSWLQIILGLLIIVSLLVQEYAFPKPHKKMKVDKPVLAAGFMAGILNATAAMAPLPVILWMRSHIVTPDQVRHNLAAFFILVNAVSVTVIHHLKPSAFNSEVLMICVLILPLIFIGALIGERIALRVNTVTYRKIVFAAVIISGLISTVAGALTLI